MAETIAPSSVGADVTQDSENLARTMAGLEELRGVELDRFGRRQERRQFRQEQLSSLEEALDDREAQAEEVAQTLLQSGLSDVAERFRRASRRQSFNAARRGFQGGSAEIQQRAETEARADAEAEDAALRATDQRLRMQLGAMQEGAGLQRRLLDTDPLEAALTQAELTGERQQTEQAGAEQRLRLLQQQARRRRSGALGGAIGGTLSSLGNVGFAGLVGSA